MSKTLFLCSFLLLLLSHSLLISVEGVIEEEDIKNAHGDVLLHVSDGNRIKVFNRHRSSSPTVRFSLIGTAMDKVEQSSDSSWALARTDQRQHLNISIENMGPIITKYFFHWHIDVHKETQRPEDRELCFHYGTSNWYAGYQSMNTSWPMNPHKQIERQQFNFLLDQNRYENPKSIKEHAFILEHLYLTSDGFALSFNPNFPLFIRRTAAGEDPLLCLSVRKEFPYDTSAKGDALGILDIEFFLFTSENVRTVLDFLMRDISLIRRPEMMPPDERLFSLPIWGTADVYPTNPILFPSYVQEHGFPTGNVLIFNAKSLEDIERYALSTSEEPTEERIAALHTKEVASLAGIQIGALTLRKHPATEHLCIQPCTSERHLVDFSHPDARALVHSHLTALKLEKDFDVFYISAEARLSSNFTLHDPIFQLIPNRLTTEYIETAASVPNITIITEFAYRTQHLPVWVKLSVYQDTPSAQILQELIPAALSVSVAGYPFIIPYSAGRIYNNDHPSKEIYIRMIQAATFMPGMLLTTTPWQYSDSAALTVIVKKFFALHADHAPLMIELAKKRIQTGALIIRPLWYVAPEDPATYKIGDQYMVGDDIVVAPVVVEGGRQRAVYLPAGNWVDQHGKIYTGGAEYQIQAPLEELPYFKRQH